MSTTEDLKACCSQVYASDWARLLLGDALHPGGLVLTRRLGDLVGVDATSRVLDLASGRGASALYLAREFGCEVIGIDYSDENVTEANSSADDGGLADRVRFFQGDAERLTAWPESSFDAVICECAYCTFPDKAAAAREVARVLRPGGRFGLADLTRSGLLPPELEGLLAWIACIGDALPVEDYVQHCAAAGLCVEHVEAHDAALSELVHTIRGRLLSAEILTKLRQVNLPGIDLQQAKTLARAAADAIAAGRLGYGLVVATRPAAEPV
jgi:arsenite methyltransferase